MKLIITINSVWNVCIWYIIFESTLGCQRHQYVTAFSTISYKLTEQGSCCYYGQFKLGYIVGHRKYVPQIGGILSNRINKGFNNTNNNYKVNCVDENNNWVEDDLMKDNGSLTNSIIDIERGIIEANDSISEDIDNETKDKNGFENMLVNKELSETPTEKRIKIPYIVEYPTDRVSEEQDMTKEDVARSIMTELGFFYPSSSYSSFRYYGDTTSTFNTPDRGVTGSSSRVDNRDSDLTTSEAGGSTGCGSDMALVGTNQSNVTSSCTNEVGVNRNGGITSGIGIKGLTFSQSSGTDSSVDEEQEDPKSYLLKTTLATKLNKKEEDAPASILDEQESPVVGQQRVRWFPNYVSRSLRKLHDYLKSSDLILDVRDGRMPYVPFNDYFFNIFESEFPMKPRITVFTHSDLLPRVGITDWLNYYRRINKLIAKSYNANITDPTQRRVENRTMFVDARNGLKEIIYLRKHIYRMTRRVRERCIKRGMRPRGIRVIVVGMPNVGKSSLVNRLLGRRAARATAAPGTTRDINLYNEKVARNEGSSTNYTTRPTKSDTGAENDENGTRSSHSVRGFKRLVLIDTPGIITPLTDLAKPLLKLLTNASNRNSPLKSFSTINSSADGSFRIVSSDSNVTYGNKGSISYSNDRYSVANSSTINFGSTNVSDRQTMMLIYSGLNIIGESACEDDEVVIVILKEILRMLTIRPKYIETAKIRQKYPLLVTMINRFIASGRGPNRDWLDVESEISYNLERISRWLFGGNLNSCCSKMLNDFRRGKLGHVMLQAPPYLALFSTRASSSDTESGRSSNSTRNSSSGLQVSTSNINGGDSMKNEQARTSNTKDGNGKVDRDKITLEYSMGAYEGW